MASHWQAAAQPLSGEWEQSPRTVSWEDKETVDKPHGYPSIIQKLNIEG